MRSNRWNPAGEGRYGWDTGTPASEGDPTSTAPDAAPPRPAPVVYVDSLNHPQVGSAVYSARVTNIPPGWTFFTPQNAAVTPTLAPNWNGGFTGQFALSPGISHFVGYASDFTDAVAFDLKDGIDVDFSSFDKVPGVGNIVIHSDLPMRRVIVSNTAGATVAAVDVQDATSAQLNFIPQDTYRIKAIGTDGTTRRISGVQVVAGRSSEASLTALSNSAPQPGDSDETDATPSADDAPVEPTQETTPTASHAIVLVGLLQGDRASLLRGSEEIAPVVAQGNTNIEFSNLSDGDYVLHVSFTTGQMVNRIVTLSPTSAETVLIDLTSVREAEKTSYVVPALITGGLLLAAGGYYWTVVRPSRQAA